MAKIITHGKAPLWGVYTPASPDAFFIGSMTVSVTVRDHVQLDNIGADAGYVAYALDIPFNLSGELALGASSDPLMAASSIALPLAGGAIPWHSEDGSLAALDKAVALPAASTLLDPAACYPIIRSCETSASRDAARTINTSGNYFPFSVA